MYSFFIITFVYTTKIGILSERVIAKLSPKLLLAFIEESFYTLEFQSVVVLVPLYISPGIYLYFSIISKSKAFKLTSTNLLTCSLQLKHASLLSHHPHLLPELSRWSKAANLQAIK